MVHWVTSDSQNTDTESNKTENDDNGKTSYTHEEIEFLTVCIQTKSHTDLNAIREKSTGKLPHFIDMVGESTSHDNMLQLGKHINTAHNLFVLLERNSQHQPFPRSTTQQPTR